MVSPFCFRLQSSLYRELKLTKDDIQGTGCVTQAAVKSAVWVAKVEVKDQKIVIFGAGTAGTGIADQLRDMISLEGKSKEEATKQIWYSPLEIL